jgi:hypothetical protein
VRVLFVPITLAIDQFNDLSSCDFMLRLRANFLAVLGYTTERDVCFDFKLFTEGVNEIAR